MILTDPKTWWLFKKEDIMQDVYWQQGKIPPQDKEVYEQEWKKIKKQLGEKYGYGKN